MLTSGVTREGESGTVYSFIKPLMVHARQSAKSSLWIITRATPRPTDYMAKGPSVEDDKSRNWPSFQHELKMQRLFIEDKLIRRMVDYLPSSGNDEPAMVLEPFEQTLWDCRNARPMTTPEIKWIMEGVLGLHVKMDEGYEG
ncbi:putative Protein kinase domain-containing protein [Seiridium cardinale]|uniref:Uncharacterized protein n=1 Tax=Seiridium cardinale TaxID=138064 RepID=A0ABR2XAH3_9PEZI